MEQSLVLLVSPSRDTATTLQMKYTERRLEDAKTLLSRDQSSEGLTYLQDQIVSTGTFISSSKTSAEQSVQAARYIETLQKVSQELEVQNRTMDTTTSQSLLLTNTSNQVVPNAQNLTQQPGQPVSGSEPQTQANTVSNQGTSNTTLPKSTPVPQNTPLPTIARSQAVSTLAPTKSVVVQNTPVVLPTSPPVTNVPVPITPPTITQVMVKREIEATQEKIKETIKEMEKIQKDSEENKNKNMEEKDKKQKEDQKKTEDEREKKKDKDRNKDIKEN